MERPMEKCRICNCNLDHFIDNRREHLKEKHPELEALWESMVRAKYPEGMDENESLSIRNLVDHMMHDFCETVWEVKF